jgi:hypothetical protein
MPQRVVYRGPDWLLTMCFFIWGNENGLFESPAFTEILHSTMFKADQKLAREERPIRSFFWGHARASAASLLFHTCWEAWETRRNPLPRTPLPSPPNRHTHLPRKLYGRCSFSSPFSRWPSLKAEDVRAGGVGGAPTGPTSGWRSQPRGHSESAVPGLFEAVRDKGGDHGGRLGVHRSDWKIVMDGDACFVEH